MPDRDSSHDPSSQEERIIGEILGIIGSLKEYALSARDAKGHLHRPAFCRGKTRGCGAASSDSARSDVPSLEEIRSGLADCRRCPLWPSRKSIVFGEGNPKADLLFVGEGPGEEEDNQGRPFVGPAGQLLTKIIAAMGMTRDDVYIANIVKCRPPGNRAPKPEEIAACTPYLVEQIRSIRPKVICALGSVAARYLLQSEVPVSLLRGKLHSYEGIHLMVTYHPAYLLRNPGAKKQVWEDVQKIMKFIS